MLKKNHSINIMLNLLKGFACIGVVFIHIRFPGSFGEILSVASTWATPIFFMISGYYAFGNGVDAIKRKTVKIVKIFIFGYLIFFVYNFRHVLKSHELLLWLAGNFNWEKLIRCFCFCTIDFAIPLWYLIASAETYLIWMLIVKSHKEKVALKLTPILFVLQIVTMTYCETMKFPWFWKMNFATCALPWFMMGYYFHTVDGKKYENISTFMLSITAAIGCMIAVAPTVFDLSLKFSSLGYLPYAFSLFLIALKHPNKTICKPIEYIGSNLSLNVYIFHVPISGIIEFVFLTKFNISNHIYLWCKPIIVLLSTILFALILDLLKQMRKRLVHNLH